MTQRICICTGKGCPECDATGYLPDRRQAIVETKAYCLKSPYGDTIVKYYSIPAECYDIEFSGMDYEGLSEQGYRIVEVDMIETTEKVNTL